MKKFIYLISLSWILLFSACEKEQTRSYVFWWNEAAAEAMEQDGVYILSFSVNGEKFAEESTIFYWESAPGCNTVGNIEKSFTYTSKNSWESEDIFYKVTDQNNNTLAYDVINFTGDCFQIQLDY